MKFHLSKNVLRACMVWILLACIVFGEEKQKQKRTLKNKTTTTTTGVATGGGGTTSVATGGGGGKQKKQKTTPTIPPTPPPTPQPTPPPVPVSGPTPRPTPPPTPFPTIGTLKPPTPPAPKGAIAGLQPDCYRIDSNKYNVCLELVSLDTNTAFAKGICTERCTATVQSVTCTSAQIPFNTAFDANWMTNAIEAKKKLEKLIVKDTVDPFSPRAQLPGMIFSSITDTSFIIDDVLIRVVEGLPLPTAFPAGVVAATSIQKTQTSSVNGIAYSNICLIHLFGRKCNSPPAWVTYIGPALTDIIFHEYMHCIGMAAANVNVNPYYKFDAQNRRVWLGPSATQAWRDLGCTGDIPMETSGFHLLQTCFTKEVMASFFLLGENPVLSEITAGIVRDIGYTVNYKATEKFKQQDLACGCAAFCPVIAPRCVRRLNDRHHSSSTRRRKQKRSRRQLNPETESPTETPILGTSTAVTPPLPVTVTTTPPIEQFTGPLDPAIQAELDYTRSVCQGDTSDRSCEIHVLIRAADGTMQEADYTLAELEAMVIAQTTGLIL